MARGNGLAGTGGGGDMPIDFYLRKLESTNMVEDQDMLDRYSRNVLKDYRPDKPLMASDEPRDNRDEFGNFRGGFESEGSLNLRYGGARSTALPYLPDGSFLGLTERDPRGAINEPNMRKHTDQQRARGKLVNFYNDEDHSIPESGVNPYEMQNKIKHQFYKMKDRTRIFSTSKDNFSGPFRQRHSYRSPQQFTEKSARDRELLDAQQGNRHDATSTLSNQSKVGHRWPTPDQIFKIAQYGMQKKGPSGKTQDWSKTRYASHTDHNLPIRYEDKLITKAVANLMINLSNLKNDKHSTVDKSVLKEGMSNILNRKHKFTSDDAR